METGTLVFIIYACVGLLLIFFNKQISNLNYKFILFYTNKLEVTDVFIFKIDDKNRNSMLTLTRTFTATFGFVIFCLSLYYIFQ